MDSDVKNDDVYEAPNVLGTARFLVDFPRRDYSTDFAALVAGDDEDREAYKSGLLVLGCILASIFVIWWMVLVVLKCKGKSVGCASGRSFRGERVELENRGDSAGSTDVEDEWASGAETSRDGTNFVDEVSFHSSIKSSEVQGSVISGEEGDGQSRSEYSVVTIPTTRERRTQVAFFLFGVLTLVSVPLVLTLSFSPLKRAVDDSEVHMLQSEAILSQLDNSLHTINIAVDTAAGVVDSIPSTVEELCPSRTFEEVEQEFNVDLDYIASMLTNEYQMIRDSIDNRLSDIIFNKNDFEDLQSTMELVHHETEKYLWAVPGLMLALTSVTAALMFGVLLAWKRQSNRQAQRTLSYGVLPCLICLSFVCWTVGISSALSVAILSDGCTQGYQSGTPNVAVERIIFLHGFQRNSTTFEVVDAFTGGCKVDKNPTRYVEEVEQEVQEIIDRIWEYILSVDTVGRDELINICGSESISDGIRQAQDIARLLTSIRRALSAISTALKCENIFPIYSGVVETSVCTDLATSFSWAMFMFLLLGVSTMCMISLRASWRHKVGEDQIYHEDEVAENMFLDEHEEYLHYISKYKHEWEEYGGINSVVPVTPHHRQSMYDETSESEETTGSRTYSGVEPVDDALEEDEEDPDRKQMNYLGNYAAHDDAFNPYQTTAPASPSTDGSEDISFLSLRSFQTKTKSRGEDSDADIEIAPSADSEKKGRVYSILRSASTIFRSTEKRSGSAGTHVVTQPSNADVCVNNPRIAQALSDVGRDDSSLHSLTRIRPSASEGGAFFRNGWRSRTNIEQIISDATALQSITPGTHGVASILSEPVLPGTPPLSARSKSEYSL